MPMAHQEGRAFICLNVRYGALARIGPAASLLVVVQSRLIARRGGDAAPRPLRLNPGDENRLRGLDRRFETPPRSFLMALSYSREPFCCFATSMYAPTSWAWQREPSRTSAGFRRRSSTPASHRRRRAAPTPRPRLQTSGGRVRLPQAVLASSAPTPWPGPPRSPPVGGSSQSRPRLHQRRAFDRSAVLTVPSRRPRASAVGGAAGRATRARNGSCPDRGHHTRGVRHPSAGQELELRGGCGWGRPGRQPGRGGERWPRRS